MQRFQSIDILRGLAIILMVQVHFVENLSPRTEASNWLYAGSMLFGALPAPFFAFVSGASYGLWVRKLRSARVRDREITRATLRRGGFLFVLGIAFNFFVWLPEDTFNWDILTLLGAAILALAYARKLPPGILLLICSLILLISPLLRVVSDYPTYWKDDAYEYDYALRDIIFGFLANGYFPVFPWIVFPLLGYAAGERIFRETSTKSVRWLLPIGGACIAVAVAARFVGSRFPSRLSEFYLVDVTEFPASATYVVLMLGLILMSLAGLRWWIDSGNAQRAEGRVVRMLQKFSMYSLTLYVLHHMVILWPLWVVGWWTGKDDVTWYWRNALPTPASAGLALLFLLCCPLLLRFLDRHRKFSLESLLRRWCG